MQDLMLWYLFIVPYIYLPPRWAKRGRIEASRTSVLADNDASVDDETNRQTRYDEYLFYRSQNKTTHEESQSDKYVPTHLRLLKSKYIMAEWNIVLENS